MLQQEYTKEIKTNRTCGIYERTGKTENIFGCKLEENRLIKALMKGNTIPVPKHLINKASSMLTKCSTECELGNGWT